jgi:hypothetical protein
VSLHPPVSVIVATFPCRHHRPLLRAFDFVDIV